MKKAGSPPPRSESVRVGPLDNEVRGPAGTDGKMTVVGSDRKVNPNHVDADGGTMDVTQFQAINFVPVLDCRFCVFALRDIA